MEMMNETIPCVQCRYNDDVVDAGKIKYTCTKFDFQVKCPRKNGCTFGKKRFTNADKMIEVFGEKGNDLVANICLYGIPYFDNKWLDEEYEESKDE